MATGMIKSDLPKLIEHVEQAITDAEKHRGSAAMFAKAAPLEIRFYNLATGYKLQLGELLACLKDANGTYLPEKRR